MRISLVIESDSLEGFLSELGQLQAISLQQPPAKVMAAVGKLASEPKPKDPRKEPEAERKDEPEKEPERTEPPVEEQQPAAAQAPVEAKKRRGRPKKEEPTQAAPAAPVEAVEVTQVAPPKKGNGKPAIFTRDDLTAAFKEYVVKYGYAAASSDVSKMLQKEFGPGVRKSSDVADDHIEGAINMVKAAIVDNPFSRKVEANG